MLTRSTSTKQRGPEDAHWTSCFMMKTVALSLLAAALAPVAAAATPVVMFSDLDWGPKTGWEGSATKGAAVSIWGLNFGGVRGSSYVTVNGAHLTSDADYAEWGVTAPARGLQRTTFWLKSSCTDGDGTISVTVGGIPSETIPFRVAAGAIYFVSTSGSDSNSGTTVASAWRNIYRFNPGLNPSGDGQYIVYVRGGSYTGLDVDAAYVALRGPYGGDTKRKALVAYPGEVPVLSGIGAERGLIWNAQYAPYGRNNYFTFAKLRMIGGTQAFGTWGDHVRVVGNSMEDMRVPARTGVVMVDNSQHVFVLGNYFKNCGDDSNKHNIYIKTHRDYVPGDKSVDFVTVAWNEIADPYAGSDNRGGAIFVSREGAAFSGSKYVDHIYIHSNYFHGGNMEFIYTGDSTPHDGDIWIYNNILRENGNGTGGMFFYVGTRNAYVYNNTCYGLTGDGMLSIDGTSQVISRNNIYRSTGTQQVFIIPNYGATFNSQNDLFFGAPVPSGSGISVSAARTSDPQFVSSSDFHLSSASPALDAGLSTVNAPVTRSYDGVPRPQGPGYDIGAFERDLRPDVAGAELFNYVLPQIAFGGDPDPSKKEGNWSTALYFTNTGPPTASFTIDFYAGNGEPMAVPAQGGTSVSIPVVISPGAMFRVELSSAAALRQGWASVRMPAAVKGFGIFRQSVTGREDQEAVVPLSEDSTQSYSLIWDDSGFDTAMAMANPGDTPVTVNLTVRLANGAQLGAGSINLGPKQKRAFVIRDELVLPAMKGANGSMDVSVSSGKLSLLGLRFGPVAFTSIPPAGR